MQHCDWRSAAVIEQRDVFANGAQQYGAFHFDDGNALAMELRRQPLVSDREGAANTASLKKASLHAIEVEPLIVRVSGLFDAEVGPEPIRDYEHVAVAPDTDSGTV